MFILESPAVTLSLTIECEINKVSHVCKMSPDRIILPQYRQMNPEETQFIHSHHSYSG